MSHTTSQQPTTPRFPRKEIAALLPSTTQPGGHTAPFHPDQEATTATTAQHRENPAHPHTEHDALTAPH